MTNKWTYEWTERGYYIGPSSFQLVTIENVKNYNFGTGLFFFKVLWDLKCSIVAEYYLSIAMSSEFFSDDRSSIYCIWMNSLGKFVILRWFNFNYFLMYLRLVIWRAFCSFATDVNRWLSYSVNREDNICIKSLARAITGSIFPTL